MSSFAYLFVTPWLANGAAVKRHPISACKTLTLNTYSIFPDERRLTSVGYCAGLLLEVKPPLILCTAWMWSYVKILIIYYCIKTWTLLACSQLGTFGFCWVFWLPAWVKAHAIRWTGIPNSSAVCKYKCACVLWDGLEPHPPFHPALCPLLSWKGSPHFCST